MTIIVFLVDSSASMYQRALVGGRPITFIDLAKECVENFIRIRRRNPESNADRFMLLTFEEPPFNIKSGWSDSLETFKTELNNLQCCGLTTMRAGLTNCFAMLNLHRMQSGIDSYGHGRNPVHHESTFIIVITDGGPLSAENASALNLNLPMRTMVPGYELTYEPFRWDQNVFSLSLRLPATPSFPTDPGIMLRDKSPINAICEATLGRSYCITSHRMMLQCIDRLTSKIKSGVVIHFRKIGPDPPNIKSEVDAATHVSGPSGTWLNSLAFLKIPKTAKKGIDLGFWPIPESFWPDRHIMSLPARSAHPQVLFECVNQQPMAIENLPFDKYGLQPSPLTQYILSRKQPQVCWQVFIHNSSKDPGRGHPFGYLKASTDLKSVNFFVMPYNYPVLLPLLSELCKSIPPIKPTINWLTQFQEYLVTVPKYYGPYMTEALCRMGLKQQDILRLCQTTLQQKTNFTVVNYLGTLHTLARASCENTAPVKRTNESANRSLPPLIGNCSDFSRYNLVDELKRLRTLYFHPNVRNDTRREDMIHSIPISMMGDYSAFLRNKSKLQPPLRHIDPLPKRASSFGSPFKVNKSICIDEADLDMSCSPSSPLSSPNLPQPTRKRGPIPQGAVYKRARSSHVETLSLPNELIMSPEEPDIALEPLASADEEDSTMEELSSGNTQATESGVLSEIHLNEPEAFGNRKASIQLDLTPLHNAKVLHDTLKACRQPGLSYYDTLLSLCKTFRGSVKQKEEMLKRIIEELKRFKRKTLMNLVNDILQDILQSEDHSGEMTVHKTLL